ncbi:MAG: DUF362 domain-containing protein [Candidatus Omnitrophota bacterium]
MSDTKKKSSVYFIEARGEEGETRLADKAKRLAEESGILSELSDKDFAGIKLHFGEKDNTGFIKPGIVKEIASLCASRAKHTALIETNTIYVGARSNTLSHLDLARSHGFCHDKIGVPIIINAGVTGRDFVSVKIDKKHLKEAKVASGVLDFDYILGLAHVTGHCQTGLGACIKNIGMGCASRAGKLQQHESVLPEVAEVRCVGCCVCIKWCPASAITMREKKAHIDKKKCVGCGECTVACREGAIDIKWNEDLKNLQEKMVEYCYAALLGKKKGFMNFLIKITKDCDCMAKDDPRIIEDIGILASSDPVAIDKATTDILIKKAECDRLKEGYPETDWRIQLEYASSIGLGSLDYELITIS